MFCDAGARDCALCQKWVKREGFYYSFYITLHYTTMHHAPLPQLRSTTPQYTTLHYLQLQLQLQLHYITLHYTNYFTLG